MPLLFLSKDADGNIPIEPVNIAAASERISPNKLPDAAAMLTGSIGMLPSASLDKNNKGMYEPEHGSAPDIAGQNLANPLATILSAAMMLRYSLGAPKAADEIGRAHV